MRVGLVLHRRSRFEFMEYAHPPGGYRYFLIELYNIHLDGIGDSAVARAQCFAMLATDFASCDVVLF